LPENLSADEKKIAATLKDIALGIDTISLQTKIAGNKVSLVLLELELKGLVKSLPGKVYKLTL